MPLAKAVSKAVDHCISHGILEDLLLANKAEVIKMTIFEYDEEQHKQTLLEEGYEDGFNDGKFTNLVTLVCRKLKLNQTPSKIASDLVEDPITIQTICDIASSYTPDYNIEDIIEQARQINNPQN